MTAFTESIVEEAALAWLKGIGWQVAHGRDIAPDMPAAERRDHGEVVLSQRLRDGLARLNPVLPAEALDDAFRKLTRPEGAELVAGGAHVPGIDVGHRDHAAAQQGGDLEGVDLVVLGLAAVDGLHVEGVAEDEGDGLAGAQVGEPVPGEDESGIDLLGWLTRVR